MDNIASFLQKLGLN